VRILGISCYYHDAAACLVEGGTIVAAAQEERFSRQKHDARFPVNAVRYCLAEGGVSEAPGDARLDAVVFYDKPLLKFHRILETYLTTAPGGIRSAAQALPLWLREKLWVPPRIEQALRDCGIQTAPPLYFTPHHESHAASAFYPSPFESAAILTLDGVGEWATTAIGAGRDRHVELLAEIDFPHSLGLLYSAFTYFCGFKVNSGEYKLMGLAPYGRPTYVDLIRSQLIDLLDDGSFRLNLEYFGYLDGLTMTNQRFARLFGGPARAPEGRITRREMDLARSIQEVTEDAVLKLARQAKQLTGERFLCLAGGVALNCVANGRLLRQGLFDDLWIQPAAGDAGGALGAALALAHNHFAAPRTVVAGRDSMRAALLGPSFPSVEIRDYLDRHGYPYLELSEGEWADRIAALLAEGKVVGLCDGRMEFGPRALGGRSILGDPRSPRMQSLMNLKIKFRESFRPFAPAVLEEKAADYFELDRPSPYMLLVAPVREERRLHLHGDEEQVEDLLEVVNRERSDIPAVTHVDYSARVQTVNRDEHPRFHALLAAFERRTGCAVLVNTSFNVRGEPIVCTPFDAYRCFRRTEMDYLVLGQFLLEREAQPKFAQGEDWKKEFALD
jgi:carbamoyltransferase